MNIRDGKMTPQGEMMMAFAMAFSAFDKSDTIVVGRSRGKINVVFALAPSHASLDCPLALYYDVNSDTSVSCCPLDEMDDIEKYEHVYIGEVRPETELEQTMMELIETHQSIMKYRRNNYTLPIEVVLSANDPTKNGVWSYREDGGETSFHNIKPDFNLIANNVQTGNLRVEPKTYEEWSSMKRDEAVEYHNARIAYLASEGKNKPIDMSIDHDYDCVKISDGYHRLCASLFKQDKEITIRCSPQALAFLSRDYILSEISKRKPDKDRMPSLCFMDILSSVTGIKQTIYKMNRTNDIVYGIEHNDIVYGIEHNGILYTNGETLSLHADRMLYQRTSETTNREMVDIPELHNIMRIHIEASEEADKILCLSKGIQRDNIQKTQNDILFSV